MSDGDSVVLRVAIPVMALMTLSALTGCSDDDSTGGELLAPDMAVAMVTSGQRLFDHETFGGNGRTCRTCHSGSDGTISVEEVRERLRVDPADPLFVHDGLDDFVSGTTRIRDHATVLIRRPLPPGVLLLDDPTATSAVLARGVPSTVNTPTLDPALMYDLRDQTLQEQAFGAIHGHTQNTIEPTADQLDAIALFQRTDNRFFSSAELQAFAAGGPPPALPRGRSPSEKRGREFFVDAPWNPPSKKGACAICHSGPMLNTANGSALVATGAPTGWRAFDILVSTRNQMGNPVHTFAVTDACNTQLVVQSPDPGIMMTGVYDIPMLAQLLPPEFTCILHPAFFANMFKTPQLHGVRHTAPYFHDNSARTLEDVMEHYRFYFTANAGFPITDSNILLTDQDVQDIIAFLKML